MTHKHTILVDDDNEQNMLDCEFDNVKKSNYSRKLNIVLRDYFSRNDAVTKRPDVQIRTTPAFRTDLDPIPRVGGTNQAVAGELALSIQKLAVKHEHHEKTFEQFWSAYPNKKGKAAAKLKWMKIKPDDALLTKIAHNLKTRTDWEDPKFIPHGSTYLNQERWDDQEPEEIQKYVESEAFAQKMRDKYGDKIG
jgi:hypothetical protein